MPPASEMFAATGIVPWTVEPATGCVTSTVGGVVSGGPGAIPPSATAITSEIPSCHVAASPREYVNVPPSDASGIEALVPITRTPGVFQPPRMTTRGLYTIGAVVAFATDSFTLTVYGLFRRRLWAAHNTVPAGAGWVSCTSPASSVG